MVVGGMEVLRSILESEMGLRRGGWLSGGLEVGVSISVRGASFVSAVPVDLESFLDPLLY